MPCHNHSITVANFCGLMWDPQSWTVKDWQSQKPQFPTGLLILTMSLRISSWSLNIMRWRVVTGVLRHEGNACFAAETAAMNSSYVVKGTCETTSCVAYHQNFAKKLSIQESQLKDQFLKKIGKCCSILFTHRVYNINGRWWLWINKTTSNKIRNPLCRINPQYV